MLGMRPLGRDAVRSRRSAGRRSSPTSAWVDGWPRPEPVQLAPRAGVEVEDFDFADPSSLDDPGWMAVRTLPTDVGSLTSTPRPADDRRRRQHARRPPPPVRRPPPAAPHRRRCRTRRRRVGRRRRAGVRYDEQHHVSLEARGGGDGTRVTALAPGRRAPRRTGRPTLPGGEVELRIEMSPPAQGFTAEAMGGDRIRLVARRRRRGASCSPSSTAGSGRPRPARRSPAGWSASTPPRGRRAFADLRYRGEEDAAQFRPGEVAAH